MSSFKKFNPEGSDYDYETAQKFGIKPDQSGHMPSRSPDGQILKGKKHPTFFKTIEGEEKAGYEIKKGEDGKYYSQPKSNFYKKNFKSLR